MANPITIAAKGKGYSALVKRAQAIGERYGLTSAKMDRALDLFAGVLQDHDCGASFPITASALARHGAVVRRYQARNIEFAIHGLFHVDYSQLTLEEQSKHLKHARQIFHKEKIQPTGFRCPYLRWNGDTLIAVTKNELSYDSSQALHWDVVDAYVTEGYRHVLGFYRARSANDYPALPKANGTLVQIPYCVPDDESLIERLKLNDERVMSEIWLAVLEQTYELGELFTLGLHPERIGILHRPLARVLSHARSLVPKVWIARLDEVARWWQARSQVEFEVGATEVDGVFHMTIRGPLGLTVLARNVEIESSVAPWHNGFVRVGGNSFRFRASRWPCIGLSPGSAPELLAFLKQQGYWVETGREMEDCSIYLHRPEFAPEDERPLLKWLDDNPEPIVRLGRWPEGAKSALSVTGDIDALTLFDYGLRIAGR